MHLWASCRESYKISMFLQRFTSEASPVSTAADSFFFHTCKPQAESGRSHTLLLVVPGWLPLGPSRVLQL